MSQLSGPEIKRQMKRTWWQKFTNQPPNILIRPFTEELLGSNSYDLRLGNILRIYKNTLPPGMRPAIKLEEGKIYDPRNAMREWFYTNEDYDLYMRRPDIFDPRNPAYTVFPFKSNKKETIDIEIPKSGLILSPFTGYLGATVEYTETFRLFPYIDGKSSIGRNFILTHFTAGRGDDGFCGTWTLEIACKYPTPVKPGMSIGQIYYDRFKGKRKPYHLNPKSHYSGQTLPKAASVVPIIETHLPEFATEKDRLEIAVKNAAFHDAHHQ